MQGATKTIILARGFSTFYNYNINITAQGKWIR